MSDVMTTEERIAYDRALKFNQDERVPQPFDGDVAMMHDTIDRLVAEVARLRARNEALEAVAKAAAKRETTINDDLNWHDELCHADWPGNSPCNCFRPELMAALSALNPSETPNSSGGET